MKLEDYGLKGGLNAEQIRILHEKALWLIETSGIQVPHEGVRRLLAGGNGCHEEARVEALAHDAAHQRRDPAGPRRQRRGMQPQVERGFASVSGDQQHIIFARINRTGAERLGPFYEAFHNLLQLARARRIDDRGLSALNVRER